MKEKGKDPNYLRKYRVCWWAFGGEDVAAINAFNIVNRDTKS